MNQRILELAQQVYGSAATAQEIKFAELIVQECARIAKQKEGDESLDYQSGRLWAGLDILEHFGVKL